MASKGQQSRHVNPPVGEYARLADDAFIFRTDRPKLSPKEQRVVDGFHRTRDIEAVVRSYHMHPRRLLDLAGVDPTSDEGRELMERGEAAFAAIHQRAMT